MRKTIIITGASKGIGKAIADSLRMSYNVCALSRTMSYTEDDSFISRPCDITKPYQIDWAIKKILQKFRRIDVLINNVSLMEYSPIEKINIEQFERMIEVNIWGNLQITQKILEIMKEQQEGYIINMGSTRAITGAPNKALYSMTKFALRSFTQTIAQEYILDNIKSTIICPGIVNTQSSIEKYGEEILTKSMNPIEESDIAKTIRYLISLSKNAYVPEIIIGGQL